MIHLLKCITFISIIGNSAWFITTWQRNFLCWTIDIWNNKSFEARQKRGMGYAWKTRCSGGCHRPMSYTKNTLSSVKRWQRVFRGCDLLQMRTWKNTLSSVKDHNTFLGVVIFCRSERILHVVIYRWERTFEGVIFAKIKLWILGCHLLKKMTTHRTRCHLQKITS